MPVLVCAWSLGTGSTSQSAPVLTSTAVAQSDGRLAPYSARVETHRRGSPREAAAASTQSRTGAPRRDPRRFIAAVLKDLEAMLGDGIEVVVLHVFTDKTLPRMVDRPVRDLELLDKEFLVRHFPRTERIELRSGSVASRGAAVAEELDADLVVLSSSQNTSRGRAVSFVTCGDESPSRFCCSRPALTPGPAPAPSTLRRGCTPEGPRSLPSVGEPDACWAQTPSTCETGVKSW